MTASSVQRADQGSTVSRPAVQRGGAGSTPAVRSTGLVVAPCDHKAATYAVEHWHYSRTMPMGKIVKHGVWEDGAFIGAVLYARGASPFLGSPFGLTISEVAELVRVALRSHVAPVSQLVATSLRLLRAGNPGLRAVVSYADPRHGHHGGIYQAGNWVYTGQPASSAKPLYKLRTGEVVHNRRFGTKCPPGATQILAPPKHRYVYPLDRAMRRRLAPLALPYPERTTNG